MSSTTDFPIQLYINGQWRMGEGRGTATVFNPATGQPIGEVPLATAADLEVALAASATGFAIWRATSVDERCATLRKAAALIRERAEAIAILLTTEQGKPLAEARTETLSCAGVFEFFAEEAKRSYGRVLVRQTGQRSIVIKQPVGPVARSEERRVGKEC